MKTAAQQLCDRKMMKFCTSLSGVCNLTVSTVSQNFNPFLPLHTPTFLEWFEPLYDVPKYVFSMKSGSRIG